MKTKQFIKEIKSRGFDVGESYYILSVLDDDETLIATVSKEEFAGLVTNYLGFYRLDYNTKLQLLNLLIKYAKTPIEDREEEEKYYLRQMGIGSWSFLNFNINSQEYGIAGKRDDYTYKTQFTQSEIDDMPECYTHPAVWEKIKVEREWSEMD